MSRLNPIVVLGAVFLSFIVLLLANGQQIAQTPNGAEAERLAGRVTQGMWHFLLALIPAGPFLFLLGLASMPSSLPILILSLVQVVGLIWGVSCVWRWLGRFSTASAFFGGLVMYMLICYVTNWCWLRGGSLS